MQWLKAKKQQAKIYGSRWWALGDDFRTLPISQIVAGIPGFREFALN
jgi:hypothetical protein